MTSMPEPYPVASPRRETRSTGTLAPSHVLLAGLPPPAASPASSQTRLPSAAFSGQGPRCGATGPTGSRGCVARSAKAFAPTSSASTAPGGNVSRVPAAAAATSPHNAAPAPPEQASGGSARTSTSMASGPVSSKYAVGSGLCSCSCELPSTPDLTAETARSRLAAASSAAEGCTQSQRYRQLGEASTAAWVSSFVFGDAPVSGSLSPPSLMPPVAAEPSASGRPVSMQNESASPGGVSGAGVGGALTCRAGLAACSPARQSSSAGAMGLGLSATPCRHVWRVARMRRVPVSAGPARLEHFRTPQSANASAIAASEPTSSNSSM
mmetsp:Transcript_72255/g.211726  ORF Transcript_72255/g.211726 Transcript_72255/m.211726 type:complete len:324 (+) Transcript_72255:365-1336(+)